MPERVCFRLAVKPELVDEYVERHAAVAPAMLRAIARSGRRNYSPYLTDAGELIGYYETDSDAASTAALWARTRMPRPGRPGPPGSSLTSRVTAPT